ncbi:MAG: hypothetical protein ACTTKK_10835 [Ottowia sp.]
MLPETEHEAGRARQCRAAPGYLISNFLGRFDAPRWSMVNVEALERVDALYGPFSAIDPGNSMGVTIVMTERKPKGFEASASLKYNRHRYRQYAVDDHYGSKQLSARLASRLDSGLWYAVSLQRQDSKSHPQNFVNAVRGVTNGAFASPGAGTRVDGIQYDLDPALRPRALFGASGFDHTVQDTQNLRLGHDISATQEIEGRVSFWRHDSNVSAATWLRDAAGRPVWSGRVHDGAYSFTLNGNALAPSQREDLHRQMGLTWKTRRPTGWNGSLVLTHYAMLKDLNRQASLPQPQALPGGAGSVTRRGGTGWHTLEVQAAYTPTAGMFNTEMNTDSHPDVYGGASRLNQLDLKAVWRFAPHWEWSLGVLNVNNNKAWQGHPFAQRSIQTGLRFAMQ